MEKEKVEDEQIKNEELCQMEKESEQSKQIADLQSKITRLEGRLAGASLQNQTPEEKPGENAEMKDELAIEEEIKADDGGQKRGETSLLPVI